MVIEPSLWVLLPALPHRLAPEPLSYLPTMRTARLLVTEACSLQSGQGPGEEAGQRCNTSSVLPGPLASRELLEAPTSQGLSQLTCSSALCREAPSSYPPPHPPSLRSLAVLQHVISLLLGCVFP